MGTSIDISEEAGVRYLHFGSSWIQGAMRIARPWALELEYTRDMMVALLLREGTRWPGDALLVGLGAGSLLKFLHRHRPRARLKVVEIESDVVAAARQFFKLPEPSPHLEVEIADADDYLAASKRAFDLVMVDGFDARGRPGTLESTLFYARVRGVLSDRGLVAINLLGRSRSAAPTIARIAEVFDGRALALPPCPGGNVIVFAAAGERIARTFPQLRRAAGRLRTETKLNLFPTLARLERRAAADRIEL